MTRSSAASPARLALVAATLLCMPVSNGCGSDSLPPETSSASPCDGQDCSGHGVCAVVDGVARCDCNQGYTASGLACISAGPCAGVTCSDHGTCAEVDGVAQCTCDEGYKAEGLHCTTGGGGPCDNVDCSSHGVCGTLQGEATCVCNWGYHPDGLTCAPDVTDPCAGVSCSGHGQCNVEGGLARCHCDDGYLERNLGCIERPAEVCSSSCDKDSDCLQDGEDRGLECGLLAGAKRCVGCTEDEDCRPLGPEVRRFCSQSSECGSFSQCVSLPSGKSACMRVAMPDGSCMPDLTPMPMPAADGSGDVTVCGSQTAVCNSTGACKEPTPACSSDSECAARAMHYSLGCASDADCLGGTRCVRADGDVTFCARVPISTLGCGPYSSAAYLPAVSDGAQVEVCLDVAVRGARCVSSKCFLPCNDGMCGSPLYFINQPVCSDITGTCVCTEDSDCAVTPSTPICNTTTGECECASDADCANVPGQPACIRGQCSCTTDAACDSAAGQWGDGTFGVCVEKPDFNFPSDLETSI